jgi:hypothetical protein
LLIFFSFMATPARPQDPPAPACRDALTLRTPCFCYYPQSLHSQ